MTTNYDDKLSGIPIASYVDIQYSWWNATTKFPIITFTTLTLIYRGSVKTGAYLSQSDVV